MNWYHFLLAHLAAAVYRYPSEQLIVVGVTGTNGKSSTVQFLGRILEGCGARVGWTTTAGFKVADREWANDQKMTMLGRFQTQKMLRAMVDAGCTHAIIETSSQGIMQYRHVGIHYDVAVFTNLTPEHIEAHGGFEAYKQMKGKLFAALASSPIKVIDGRPVQKVSVINEGDEHANYFTSFQAGNIVLFGRNVDSYVMTVSGTRFTINNTSTSFTFRPIGRFNFLNVLAAITTARALGYDLDAIAKVVEQLEPVPGRLERIDEGQSFHVIVDYGPEPVALQATYDAIEIILAGSIKDGQLVEGPKRLIHVLGSTGGGRDRARRAILGRMAAQHADVVIVTNEDPYDDDPMSIINEIADAAVEAGKQDNLNLFRRLDRQEAINLAMKSASEGDLVLITGKGNEPVMAVANGKKIPWDDRAAARRALRAL